MNAVPDRDIRETALDPGRSFIVQAPAGSGKTELLIQRYLRLLALVSEPEQILAITFTRKAAAEMRSRVLDALELAAGVDADLPEHRKATRRLAEAALERDRAFDWKLLEDPNRICIKTLDSFNADLAMHLPLLSGGIAGAEILDDARSFYLEAARRAVQSLWQEHEAADSALNLLAELDFSVTRAEELLASLMESREQWMHWLFDVEGTAAASQAALAALAGNAVTRIESLADPALAHAIEAMTRHAHEFGNAATSERTAGIHSGAAEDRWRAVAALLLRRNDGGWRVRVDKRDGFGPEHKSQKQACVDLLAELSGHEALREALAALQALPHAAMDAADEAMLGQIAGLLQRAVAELRVLFGYHGCADFAELNLSASQALGRVDAPSELLLALDRRLQHILVDEFQDTSQAQADLLETLTEGWESGDGRTLFLVGDPMQSIYRFRNADMSLFIGARKFGIGSVRPEALNLSANFRSAPALVDWVNDVFSRNFPDADDPASGVAEFHPCIAARGSESGDLLNCIALDSDALTDEHLAVLDIISAERAAHPDSSIAILVRSRAHLAGFEALLRGRGWQARAVEIDAPHTSQLTQDLIGIARALTHLGDRLAWLALLRAPWCGLTWAELEALVADDAEVTVWEAIHEESRLAALELQSRQRLEGLKSVIGLALRRRARLPFIQWIYETWQDLGGPRALLSEHRVSELDTVLAILDQAAAGQDITDVAELEDFFRRPARQSDRSPSSIEIMTIHRAKGLEFDCVILPGLARTPRSDNRRLVEWCEIFDAGGARSRIVAPLRKTESDTAAWIRARERELSLAETARLMYVAATRARNRLHLVWSLGQDRQPPAASLLAPLWDVLADTPVSSARHTLPEANRFVMPLRRLHEVLPDRQALEAGAAAAAVAAEQPATYNWTSGTAVQIGIVVHEWLQTICDTGFDAWDAARVESQDKALQAHLELLGVPPPELAHAAARVRRALIGVLADPRGRWIVGEREEARSEIMLSSIAGNRVMHQRLDRTFVEDGCRWIIDYKTASCDDGNVEAFLDREVDRYRDQLEAYALAMAEVDPRPIRLGLYFPMLPAFRDWPAGH